MLARGFCHRDRSLPRWRLYDLGESWQRSSNCCRTSPGPGLGIKAASGPGGALGGRRVVIRYGGGVRSSPSKSYGIYFFIISHFFVPLMFFPFPSGYKTSSSILPEESHGQRSLEGYCSWGGKKSDTTEHSTVLSIENSKGQ